MCTLGTYGNKKNSQNFRKEVFIMQMAKLH